MRSQKCNLFFQLLNQVALHHLLVKDVVEELHLGMVDGTDHFDCLGSLGEKVFGILFGVDALQQQAHWLAVDLPALDQRRGPLERLD